MPIPTDITQGDNTTAVNPTNWNGLVDGIDDIRDYAFKEAVFDVTHPTYGAVGDGATDDRTAINDAHTAATANGGVLFFPSGTSDNDYRIASNITFNSDVTLVFAPGATLAIDTGVTVTIDARIAPTLHKIFTLTGTGVAALGKGSCEFVVPQWWGALGDDSTDCVTALKAAITAMADVGKMVIPPGTYQYSTPLNNFPYDTIASYTTGYIIQGSGMGDTRLKYTGTSDYGIKFWHTDLDTQAASRGCHYITMRDIRVEANSLTSAGGGLILRGASHCLVERVAFTNIEGTYGTAIKLERRPYIQTESSMTHDTDLDFGTTGGAVNEKYAIVFTTPASLASVVSKVTVRLGKTGAPAGTITASIYTDSAGPDAIIGEASTAVTATALSAAAEGADQDFDFDWGTSVSIEASTKYWIVLETVGYTYTDGVTEIRLRVDNAGGGANAMADYDAAWNLTTDGSNNVVVSGRNICLFDEFKDVKIRDSVRAAIGYQIDDDSNVHIVDGDIKANSGIIVSGEAWLRVVRTEIDRASTGQTINIAGGQSQWVDCYIENATATYPHYVGVGKNRRSHMFLGGVLSGDFTNELGANVIMKGVFGQQYETDDPSLMIDADQLSLILPDDPRLTLISGATVIADTDAEAGRAIECSDNTEIARMTFSDSTDEFFQYLSRGAYLVTAWAKDTNQVADALRIRSGHYHDTTSTPLYLFTQRFTMTSEYKPYSILHVINDDQVGQKTYFDIQHATGDPNTLYISHITIERMATDKYGNADTFTINTRESDADGARESKHTFLARHLGPENLDETDFATHAKWDDVGDFDSEGGNATYTHAGGSGTLTQTTGNQVVTSAVREWYEFTYTVSGAAGDASAEITTDYAMLAEPLDLTDGTHTLRFGCKASATADFVISATSDSGDDTFALDDVSLKRVGLQHSLAEIKASHDGASIDEKGQLQVFVNDGDDEFSPTLQTTWGADGSLSHGDGGVTNYVQVSAGGKITFAGTGDITVPNEGLHILDTNASHDLIIKVGSDLSTDRILQFVTGDNAWTITLSGSPTLSDWFDQSIKVADSPTFAGVTLNNTGLHLLDTNASHDLIVAPGSDLTADKTLTLTTGDFDRTITLSGNPTLSDWFDQAVKVASSPTFAGVTSTADITIQETGPEIVLHNTTEEDGDGGRESSVRFKGEQTGSELTTLAMIRGSHDGAADDEKGQIEVLINDTDDADSPTLRTTWSADGSLKHGDGGTTNYMQVAADGEITLAGTARVMKAIDMAGATFEIGSTAPTAGVVGNYLTWSYDIGDDSVLTFELPHDWATGTDLTVKVDWGINRDEATENAEVQWNATWSAVPHDASEVLTGAGTTIDPGDQSIPTNANTLTRTTLGAIAGASLAVEDEIGIKIERVAIDGGNDPGAGVDPYITHLYIEYTADKLGEAT